jgi:hypothetical protein
MATNKNQHFVPRCYLRPFTVDCANKAINLFNIDRLKFIEHAPVKNQCSGDYFYGKDSALDKALQATEVTYGKVLQDILRPGNKLTDSHRDFLRRFWLLQFMRTDAASRRAVEMNAAMGDIIGIDVSDFRYGIREAVQTAMQVFVEQMNLVDDLKICLFKNRTSIPFVTSDDPAVATNRWYLGDRRTKGRSFGLRSAGNLLLLPLSPRVLCLGYDGDVYSVPHKSGWVDVRHDRDVEALNQHQFLNCWANIFVHDSAYSRKVYDTFCSIASIRPKERHIIHYAVLDRHEGDFKRYRLIDPDRGGDHQEALVHIQKVYAQPSTWPMQLGWRSRGVVFTNGTGIGYVRRAWAKGQGFRKELARKIK